MAWWKSFREQTGEAWQQLLYSLELACSGGDDLPWLDTLNFMWDSLPDADKLTTAERRRLAHSIKQRVRDNISQHYASELSHKAAIHRRQTAATARLAEQHLQKLADARQRQMEDLCSQSRQQSMRLPSIAELEQIEGHWLQPQQGGGQPWPLLLQQQQQQQQQQQRALSGQLLNRRQQQGQQVRRVGMEDHGRQRVTPGSARNASSASSSSRLERVLSGDEAAEDTATGELAQFSGDVVINISDGCSTGNNSNGSEIEPVAMHQQRVSALRCIVGNASGVGSSTSELQQPLLPPVVESPFAAPQQQLQQQHKAVRSTADGQQQQDFQYEPPTVLVLAAAKLQQQLEEQQEEQQAPGIAPAITTGSSGSGMWTFRFSQPQAAASAQLSTPGYGSQLLQVDVARASAGDQGSLQQSGSQLLLQRYLDGSQPAAHADSAAATAIAAGCAAVHVCAADDARKEQQQQQNRCTFLAEESEPSSECATATSSTADQYSSYCGGGQSDTTCDASVTPRAATQAGLKMMAAAGASTTADVATHFDMFV